jgi:hypothetical protein
VTLVITSVTVILLIKKGVWNIMDVKRMSNSQVKRATKKLGIIQRIREFLSISKLPSHNDVCEYCGVCGRYQGNSYNCTKEPSKYCGDFRAFKKGK